MNLHALGQHLFLLAAMVASAGCVDTTVDEPDADSLEELKAAYLTPTGSLDDAAVTDLVQFVEEPPVAEESELPQSIEEQVAAAAQAVEQTKSNSLGITRTKATQPTYVQRSAAISFESAIEVEVEQICPGWGDAPTVDASNGSIVLRAVVDDLRVHQVMRLSLKNCRVRTGVGRDLELRAGTTPGSELLIDVGPSLVLGAPPVDPWTVALDLNVLDRTSDASIAVKADFRRTVNQLTEYRVFRDGKYVIPNLADDGAVGVRAKNGAFECDISDLSCTSDTGTTVVAP